MTKLHLGCGRLYLDGYVNIDFPDTRHTVQKDLAVDLYADIQDLSYPKDSIDEIRLHHVFEHFSRPVALALLCRWRNWLRPGGLLRIETPDANACFKQMLSPFLDFVSKQQVMRHLFGSHEASWAFHFDGWYEEKFKVTLSKLGYCDMSAVKTKREILRNIEVSAIKSSQELLDDYFEKAVKDLLTMSAVRLDYKKTRSVPDSEKDMIRIWMDEWRSTYHFKTPDTFVHPQQDLSLQRDGK